MLPVLPMLTIAAIAIKILTIVTTIVYSSSYHNDSSHCTISWGRQKKALKMTKKRTIDIKQ